MYTASCGEFRRYILHFKEDFTDFDWYDNELDLWHLKNGNFLSYICTIPCLYKILNLCKKFRQNHVQIYYNDIMIGEYKFNTFYMREKTYLV